MDKEVQDAMAVYETNLEGRALVQEMKEKIIDVFHKHGAIHMQCGKTLSPAAQSKCPVPWLLLRSIKGQVRSQQSLKSGRPRSLAVRPAQPPRKRGSWTHKRIDRRSDEAGTWNSLGFGL